MTNDKARVKKRTRQLAQTISRKTKANHLQLIAEKQSANHGQTNKATSYEHSIHS